MVSLSLDKQIYIAVKISNPEGCRGDCPNIEQVIPKKIGTISINRMVGTLGAVGGSIPQKLEWVVFENNGYDYSFTVYELETDAQFEDGRKMGDIPADEKELFNKIIKTFKPLNS